MLARTVTHSSVAEAQTRIDSVEFTEWLAEYAIEPWGEERDDLRSALQTAHLVASHAKPGSVLPLKRFLLTFDEPDPDRASSQLEAHARAAAAAVRRSRRRRLGRHR